jgi:hypothetical protein
VATKRKKVSGSARATIDHEEIRSWVEEHGGNPAMVKRTRSSRGGSDSGILRIDFPGFSGETSLEPISWDEFFERFETAELAFLYQDVTGSGSPSNFNKLVKRDSVEVQGGADTASSEQGSGARRTAKTGNARNARKKKASTSRATSSRKASPRKKTSSRKKSSSRGGQTVSLSNKAANAGGGARAAARTARKKTSRKTTAQKSGAAPARKRARKTSSARAR